MEFADNYFFLTFFNLNLIVKQLADEGANEQRVLLVEQSTTQRQIAIIGERSTGSRWTLRNLARSARGELRVAASLRWVRGVFSKHTVFTRNSQMTKSQWTPCGFCRRGSVTAKVAVTGECGRLVGDRIPGTCVQSSFLFVQTRESGSNYDCKLM